MKEELLNHKLQYGILIIGLLGFTILFLGVWPDRQLQRLTAIGIALFYASWGILTHVHSATISRKVVTEYLSISTLALVLLLLVTS